VKLRPVLPAGCITAALSVTTRPKGPEDSGEEIDEQTRKQGVNYYKVSLAAARGDKKALKAFCALGLDARPRTHSPS
jgi:hypothetical protein